MTDVRTAPHPRPSERRPARPRRLWVLAVWAVAAVVVSAWLALVEVLWLPLRIGSVLVPVSVLTAVLGTPLQVFLAHRLSGSRVVAVLPAAVWMVVALAASTRRAEGDLLITGGGASGVVNLAFLLLGIGAASVALGRVLTARPARPAGRRRKSPSSARGGSGSGGAR